MDHEALNNDTSSCYSDQHGEGQNIDLNEEIKEDSFFLKLQQEIQPKKLNLLHRIFFLFRFLTSLYMLCLITYLFIEYDKNIDEYSMFKFKNEEENRDEYFIARSQSDARECDNHLPLSQEEEYKAIIFNDRDRVKASYYIYMIAKLFITIYLYKDLYQIFSKDYYTPIQQATVRLRDYFNLIFDYSFAVALSPVTAFNTLSKCISMLYLFPFPLIIYYICFFYGLFSIGLLIILASCSSGMIALKLLNKPYRMMYFVPWFFISYVRKPDSYEQDGKVYYRTGKPKYIKKNTGGLAAFIIITFLYVIILFIAAFFLGGIPYMYMSSVYFVRSYYILTTVMFLIQLLFNRGSIDFYQGLIQLCFIASYYYTSEFERYFGKETAEKIHKEYNSPELVGARNDFKSYREDAQSVFKHTLFSLSHKVNKYQRALQEPLDNYMKKVMK